MWRCLNVMWMCGDVDVEMCRCGDVEVWRCVDVEVWRCGGGDV